MAKIFLTFLGVHCFNVKYPKKSVFKNLKNQFPNVYVMKEFMTADRRKQQRI